METVAGEQGPVLGFMERAQDYPKVRYELRPGELLLLYTDGVTEAPAPDNQMFGAERLRASLAEAPFPSQLSQWIRSLRRAIEQFTGNRSQEDDITLALLRVR